MTDTEKFKTPRVGSNRLENLRPDLPALAFIFAVFLVKGLSANRHSYWMDEMASVWITGVGQDTFFEAMGWFVRDGNHPPLYEVLLYGWMMVFGDSEMSTRNLSNLFVALASLGFYALLRQGFSRLTAFNGLVLFSASSLTVEYSLEARSYGLLLLAVITSSLALAAWMRTRIGTGLATSWHWTSKGWALLVANTAVLMTHYFGLFFLAAQALFVLAFIAKTSRKPIREGLATLALWYAAPAGIFLTAWGWVFFPTFISSGTRHAIDGPASLPPWELFFSAISRPTFAVEIIGAAVSILIAVVFVFAGVRVVSRRNLDDQRQLWLTTMFGFWLFLPFGIVYLAFTLIGAEQYSARYFLFSLPAFFALIAVAVEKLGHYVTRLLGRPNVRSAAASGLASVLLLTMLPVTSEALAAGKGQYRDVAEEVIYYVEQHPDYTYAVFETDRGKQSKMDYYFERLDTSVRSSGNFPLFEESGNDFDILRKDLGGIRDAERVIVAFPSDPIQLFPNLQSQLEEDFDLVFIRESPNGTGFLVYSARANLPSTE